MRIAILSLLALTSCAGSPFNRAPSSKDLPWGLESRDVPDPNAIVRWSDPHYEETGAAHLDDVAPVEIACADKHLFPTHPQQRSKIYHVYRNAIYDNTSVPADSRTCKIASKSAKPVCLLTDIFEYAVISDVFEDACGSLYRGYWSVGFLKQDDSMGMLLSKGRTVYPKASPEYAGETEVGSTYGVDAKDFLFLGAPLPGDKATAEKLAREATATHTFDTARHLFLKRELVKARPKKEEPIALEPVLAE